jgi:hypothetical protein
MVTATPLNANELLVVVIDKCGILKNWQWIPIAYCNLEVQHLADYEEFGVEMCADGAGKIVMHDLCCNKLLAYDVVHNQRTFVGTVHSGNIVLFQNADSDWRFLDVAFSLSYWRNNCGFTIVAGLQNDSTILIGGMYQKNIKTTECRTVLATMRYCNVTNKWILKSSDIVLCNYHYQQPWFRPNCHDNSLFIALDGSYFCYYVIGKEHRLCKYSIDSETWIFLIEK